MPSFLVSLAAAAAADVPVTTAGITTGRAAALGALVIGLISVVIGVQARGRPSGGVATGTRPGRALAALVVGLIAVVVSGRHLASSGPIGTGSGRLGAIVALAVGLIGTVLGGLALARSRRSS
jgi:hypothetical protein